MNLSTIGAILVAILAFGVMIMVHELGHFFTAKKSGVRVNEFWIGMGPAIWKKQKGETTYCLRALPFGGACVMEGEDEANDEPDAFGNASIGHRALILAAGALMNFLLGFVILIILYLPNQVTSIPQIASFADGFQYEGEEMLMVGDRIESIDGYAIWQSADISTGLSLGAADGEYNMVVKRDGKTVKLTNVPLKAEIQSENGSKVYGLYFETQKATILSNIRAAAVEGLDMVRMVWVSLRGLISGQYGVNDLSGPVGVTGMMVETVQNGLRTFFWFVAFISINLGVMNLLPLPALDGGRLLFLVVEAVRGKPVPPKYEGVVHAVGLALLLVLMVYVTGHDILRLITGG